MVLRDYYSASADGVEAAMEVLSEAVADRRLLLITDYPDSDGHRRSQLCFLARKTAECVDVNCFIGSKTSWG